MSNEDSNTAHDVYKVNQDKASAEAFGNSLNNLPSAASLGVNSDVYNNIQNAFYDKDKK